MMPKGYAICKNCGKLRPLALMNHEHIWERSADSPEYDSDLVDDFFCMGIYTAVEGDDPCDSDNYESCFDLWCKQKGIDYV